MHVALPLLATITTVAAAGGGKLNGYWGQNGYIYDRLSDYCDTGVSYVSLSFVTRSPEHDNATGYPATGFAAHCGGEYYYKNGHKSGLLQSCETLKEDIPKCQAKGIKVLLSIGGEWSTESDYRVSTDDNGRYFSDFLWTAFGPFNATWDGPRPFDSETTHNAIDGFDFDIEGAFDNKPYIAMVDRFRELEPSMFISAAPQCPLALRYFYLRDLIQRAQLDALFIQFYNNEGCDAVMKGPDDAFNYDAWEDVIASSDKSKNAKLYIGLQPVEGSSGYITASQMQHVVCQYQNRPHFGGISLWDMTLATKSVQNGTTYVEAAMEVLKKGCTRPSPSPSPTTAVVSTPASTPA